MSWDAVLYWGDGSEFAPLQATRFKSTHMISHFPIF